MTNVEPVLAHHGVKGMKWGVRRERTSSVHVSQNGRKLKSTGGHDLPAHEDAVRARMSSQRAKKSGVHALSNSELRSLVERLNLEQQYGRLNSPNKGEVQKFVEQQLKSVGQQRVQQIVAAKAAGR